MDLMANNFFVTVFDNEEDVSQDCASLQCFWISRYELKRFLNICRKNGKYVQIEINYAKELENAQKNG